jgi:hypothetical protein
VLKAVGHELKRDWKMGSFGNFTRSSLTDTMWHNLGTGKQGEFVGSGD